MKLSELEFMLNEKEHQTRVLRRSNIIEDDEKPFFLSLRLNPSRPDDAFILKHVKDRKGNAALLRILLLAHFRTMEDAENVK